MLTKCTNLANVTNMYLISKKIVSLKHNSFSMQQSNSNARPLQRKNERPVALYIPTWHSKLY